MSSTIHVYIDEEDKPTNFPSYGNIIEESRKLRPSQVSESHFSGVKLPLEPERSGSDSGSHDDNNEVGTRYIWVKFGCGVRMGEARTQRYVSQYLGENDTVRAPRVYAAFTWGTCGFIVSEYVDGRICDDSDIPLIIAAMQSLIEIPSPQDQTMPGPVGGGIIEHPGFNESESPIWYETVQELEDHLNGASLSLYLVSGSQDDNLRHRFSAYWKGPGR